MEWMIVVGVIGFLYLLSSGINKCVTSLQTIEHLLGQMAVSQNHILQSVSSDVTSIQLSASCINDAAQEIVDNQRRLSTFDDEDFISEK